MDLEHKKDLRAGYLCSSISCLHIEGKAKGVNAKNLFIHRISIEAVGYMLE